MKRMSLAILLAVAVPAFSQDVGHIDKDAVEKVFPKRPYSPYAGRNYPTRPFFGDTHLHTSFSMDGGAAGARLGPVEAYRFAKGRGSHRVERPAGEALETLSIFSSSPITRMAWASSRC